MLVVTSLLDTLLVRPQVACACEKSRKSQLYETGLSIGWVCVCVCGVGGNSVWSSECEVQGTQKKKPRQTQGDRERRE